MEKDKNSEAASLREKAVELLKAKRSTSALPGIRKTHQLHDLSNYYPITSSEADILKLLHELEVHQIEMQLQNEGLIVAKEKAEVEAEKYAELYDFAPSGYFSLSKKGKIIEINLYGSQMLGKERSCLKNSKFGFFVSNDTKPIFNHFLEKVFSNKAKECCEVTLSTNGNSPMYVQLTGSVTKNGEQCHLSGVDFTERRLAEQEIKLKTEQLIQADAEKDKFFSIIAHDLRSPFQTLLGFTRMLTENLPTLKLDEIQMISMSMGNSANKLFKLLENLLEWSQMQRGLIGFKPKSFILLNGIASVVELVREAADLKEIKISYDVPEDLRVTADAKMLDSILRNLVFNAVKFTPKGGKVLIMAKQIPEDTVEISVNDTGIGMNMQMIGHLFHLDELTTNGKGTEGEPGTGLGLIICKDFIEKHSGKLWVESKVGKGSTFYFTMKQ